MTNITDLDKGLVNPKLIKAVKNNPPKNPTIYDDSFYTGFKSLVYDFQSRTLTLLLKNKTELRMEDVIEIAEHIHRKVSVIIITSSLKRADKVYKRKGKVWKQIDL